MASAIDSNFAEGTAETTEVLDGVVDRITYVNDENGYTVARLKVPRQKQLITIAGYLPGIGVGEGLRLYGRWVVHPQYGRQFLVQQYATAAPGTAAALKKYLGSGLLKGVGPVMAEHIVNAFGTETLRVLDEAPERLAEVRGLSKAKATAIAEAWRERRALKELMAFLQEQGLSVALAVRIIKKYGSAAEEIVRQQPYRLTAEVFGVDFKVADGIAATSGVPRDAVQRLGAGFAEVLRAASGEGHSFLSLDALLPRVATLLGLPVEQVRSALPTVEQQGFVVLDALPADGTSAPVEVAYLPPLHEAEIATARALLRLAEGGNDRLRRFKKVVWADAWAKLDSSGTLRLTDEQKKAVEMALTERVSVITGGPGTGKTTTLRSIVGLATNNGGNVVLAAPTGRAARRLSEASGVPASTIHRLLELRPGGRYEARAPLDADLVVIDEASMMDLPLSEALLTAVPTGAHLLLVGDVDQLPPVGAGAFFKDVIASARFPVVVLNTVFRQPEGSAIVHNAHRINRGAMPELGKGVADFFFLSEPDPASCARLMVDLVVRRLPARYGLDPLNDIQVLAPTYGGLCGVDALNESLQQLLNPPRPDLDERRFGSRIYRAGDKVMQLVNDYDRQVANGELGRILRIDHEAEAVVVAFDGDWTVTYSFAELDELTHAYAISVHKAQGSEFPAVVIPLLPQHGRLLQRNLLYTAVTRARRLLVLAGSPGALRKGINNTTAAQRNSGLTYRLS